MKGLKRSKVWPFFDLKKNELGIKTHVVCKLCDVGYKYHGTTSNLKLHLEKAHPLQWSLANDSDGEDANLLQNLLEDSTEVEETVRVRKRKNEKAESDSEEVQYIFKDDDNQTYKFYSSNDPTEEWIEGEEYDTKAYETPQKKVRVKREVITPVRETGSFYPNTGRTVIIEKPEKKEDECTSFGQFVGCKLRNLKEKTRGNIQQLISTILWQAEYGMYDNNNTIKDILLNVIAVASEEERNSTSDQNDEKSEA